MIAKKLTLMLLFCVILLVFMSAFAMDNTKAEETEDLPEAEVNAVIEQTPIIVQDEANLGKGPDNKENLDTDNNAYAVNETYVDTSVAGTEKEGVAEQEEVKVDPDEYEMLACVIFQEAGANYISDETRYMVGDVVLNRMASSQFPNTMYEVLTAPSQYGMYAWTGIVWVPEAAYAPEAVQRAYDTAWNLLTDTRHSSLYGNGYIWQAEFPQGTDIIHVDGLYFGR